MIRSRASLRCERSRALARGFRVFPVWRARWSRLSFAELNHTAESIAEFAPANSRRASQALRERAERYQELFESMSEGFCVIEWIEEADDFRIVEANPAFGRQSGLADVDGRTLRELIGAEAEEWIAIYQNVLETGEPLRFARELASRGRWLEVYAYRVGDGAKQHVGVVFHDITENRRAQEILERSHSTFYNLIQNDPFGVYVIDADFRLAIVSLGAQKVFSNVCPLIGRDFAEVLRIVWPEPFATEAIELFRHTLKTGESYSAPSTVERRHDIAETEAYDWRIDRIALPDGRLGVVCYFYDLSERQRLSEELATAQRKLQTHATDLEAQVSERTCKLRDTIAELETISYSISHDMRAPLRAMQGFAQALLDDHKSKLDADGAAYLERISSAARRLDSLIQDILLYTGVTREKLVLADIALEPAVREIIVTYHPDQEGCICVERPLPAVRAHQAFLSQILSNLITNALKFVPRGRVPRVRIRAEDAGEFAKIWVEDEGIGISPEHASRIFQVFGRLHSDSEYPGTGIGLAIVKRAAERLGGEVGVQSAPGQGSRFWITLRKA